MKLQTDDALKEKVVRATIIQSHRAQKENCIMKFLLSELKIAN